MRYVTYIFAVIMTAIFSMVPATAQTVKKGSYEISNEPAATAQIVTVGFYPISVYGNPPRI